MCVFPIGKIIQTFFKHSIDLETGQTEIEQNSDESERESVDLIPDTLRDLEVGFIRIH